MPKLEILNIPAFTPANFLEGGKLFVDLPSTEGYRITQNRAELTEFDQIQDEAVLPLELPQTVKNEWIFREYLAPSIVDNTYPEIAVRASEGAIYLPQDVIQVLGANDPANAINVNLAKSDNFWLKGARKLKIRDIDFGTFTFTKANIEAQWANPDWQTGDPYVNFWTTHWGQDYTPTYFFEYHRPYLSILGTLIQGFCALGWQFSSETFETDWGRRLWWYGLKQDLFQYTGKADLYNVRVTWDGATWDETAPNYDNGNKFQPANDRYFNSGAAASTIPQRIRVNWRETFTNPAGSGDTFFYTINLEENDNTITPTGVNYTESFTVLEGDTVEIDKTWEFDLATNFGFDIEASLQIGAGAPGVTTPTTGTVITIDSIGDYYHDGDVLTINELVNQDTTFYEFLQGVIGLGDFKLFTDYSTQTVSILPRVATSVSGSSVSGYLNDNSTSIDLTTKIVKNSLVSTVNKQEVDRFQRYTFKNSTDTYIKDLDLPDDAPLYSRTVDLGFGNEKETNTIANPFFEPTSDADFGNITIPHIWDNDDNNVSKDIGPRIVYGVGAVAQLVPGQGVTQGAVWNYDGDAAAITLGYGSQDPNRTYTGGIIIQSTNDAVRYADPNNSEDLYTMFIRKNLFALRQSVQYEFLARLTSTDWAFLNFREKLKIFYNGFTFFAELLEKRDHQLGSNLPTPIVVTPDLALSTQLDCELKTYTATGANNFLFAVTLGGGTDLGGLGGFNFAYLNDGVTVGTIQADLNAWLATNDPNPSATATVTTTPARVITFTVTSTIVFQSMTLSADAVGTGATVFNFTVS